MVDDSVFTKIASIEALLNYTLYNCLQNVHVCGYQVLIHLNVIAATASFKLILPQKLYIFNT